jgi:hypothetical protein
MKKAALTGGLFLTIQRSIPHHSPLPRGFEEINS